MGAIQTTHKGVGSDQAVKAGWKAGAAVGKFMEI